jgi:hypothetical protein
MKYAMLLFALALGGLAASSIPCAAEDYEADCCGTCGCRNNCNKVCRVVCEMKDVKEVRYKVVCEDFCVPGRSDKCGCKWIPGCADVHTKRKLVKYEVTCKKPEWKWKVENLCPSCTPSDAIPANDMPATPPLPSPPQDGRSGEL